MYQDLAHTKPGEDVYTSPCGRYSVERAGPDRYDVFGPNGRVATERHRYEAIERACILAEGAGEVEKVRGRNW